MPVQAQNSIDPAPSLSAPPAGLTLNLDQGPVLEGEVFRIGFLADAAPGHQQRVYQPFQAYVEAVLQRPVELIPYVDPRALIIAIDRKTVVYAIAPGSVFAATHRHCACVDPLGVQGNRDGSMGVRSVLVVPDTPSAPTDIAAISEARVAVLGEGSVVAHRVGLSELWRLQPSVVPEAVMFAGSMGDALERVRSGTVSAILAWSRQGEGEVVFEQEPFATLSDEDRASLRILWRSRTLPGNTHFLHRDLEESERTQLETMLLRMAVTDGDAFDAIDQGSGRAFVEASLSDFQPYLDAYTYWDQVGEQEP